MLFFLKIQNKNRGKHTSRFFTRPGCYSNRPPNAGGHGFSGARSLAHLGLFSQQGDGLLSKLGASTADGNCGGWENRWEKSRGFSSPYFVMGQIQGVQIGHGFKLGQTVTVCQRKWCFAEDIETLLSLFLTISRMMQNQEHLVLGSLELMTKL